jgi:hypothetical protein
VTLIGKQPGYHGHPSFLTDGTEGNIDPTDPEELFLPGLFPGVWLGYGLNVFENLTTSCDVVFAFSVCQQAEVAYPDIARGQDMKEESSDKLACLERHGLLAVVVCIISP